MVFRDVTQRREVDRMKSEFVSLVARTAHPADRDPWLAWADRRGGPRQADPAGQPVWSDIALVSSERLARLINEILDIERIESRMLTMDLQNPAEPT